MDDLRKRTDSLDPPYPSFGEFIRGLLEDQSARKIADLVGTREETVNAWASDHAPGTQFHSPIREKLGYDIGEYHFRVAAEQIHFPPEEALPEILAVRSNAALRQYLRRTAKQANRDELTRYFDLSSRSLLTGFDRGENLSSRTLVKFLERLPEVPCHLSGEILSPLTPTIIIAQTVLDCRLKSGEKNREAYAQQLGITIDYLRYLEDLTKRAPEQVLRMSGATQNRERMEKLCRTLMAERARFGLPAGAAAGSSERSAKGVVTPSLGDRVAALEAGLARVETMVRRLADSRGEALPSAGKPFTSPFRVEAWREHDLPVSEEFLALVELEVKNLVTHLAFLAQVRDEATRGRIRAQLTGLLMVELLGAMDAFSQRHPSAVLTLIKSWRKFQADWPGGERQE